MAAGKLENLIALIDEILAARARKVAVEACTSDTQNSVQGQEWGEEPPSFQFAPNAADTAMTSSTMRK